MRRLAILGVASSLAMLAACSCATGDKTAAPPIQSNVTTVESSAASTATEPAPDNTPSAANDETAFATSMLATLSDFPDGWIARSSLPDSTNGPIQRCATRVGRTGSAVSDKFAQDANAADVMETVVVFDTVEHAIAGVDQTRGLVDCALRAIGNGELDKDSVRLSNASATEITVQAPGDKSRSYLVNVTATRSDGQPQATHALLLYASVGRVGYSFQIQSSAPLDSPAVSSLLSQIARRAAARIRQQP